MSQSSVLRILCYAVLSVAMFGMSSCRSSKNSSNYTGDINTTGNDASTTKLFEELVETYKPWSDLYVPVELSLESPKKMSISGRATMVYGKEINISLRLLGMEVGYVYINESKIYVVDKFHKCYYTDDISKLIKGYDITIKDLQDLLLGRAILPGKGIIEDDDINSFTFLSSDTQWIMSPINLIEGADWHYIASRTDPPILSAVSMRIKGAGAMECRFTEPTNTSAGVVDGVMTLTLPYKTSDLVVSITWLLNDAKWDSGRDIKFTPPNSSYKLLDIERLIKSMSSDQ